MKKIALPIFIVFSFSYFFSCTKGENVSKPKYVDERILKYLKFSNAETDGSFMLQSFATQATQNHVRDYSFDGAFFDKNNQIIEGALVKIDDVEFKSNNRSGFSYHLSENSLKKLYGKKVKITLSRKKSIGTANRSSNGGQEFYVPRDIELITPELGEGNVLQAGTTIEWNADTNNDKGLLILVEYDPNFVDNGQFRDAGHDGSIYKYVVAEESGSYTLTAEDIEGLPLGSTVILKLIRANYVILEDDEVGEYYSVMVSTIVEQQLTIGG